MTMEVIQSPLGKAWQCLPKCKDYLEFLLICLNDLHGKIIHLGYNKLEAGNSETIDVWFENYGGIRVTKYIDVKKKEYFNYKAL